MGKERTSPEGPKEDIYSKSLASGSDLAAYFKETSPFITHTCIQPKGMLHSTHTNSVYHLYVVKYVIFLC